MNFLVPSEMGSSSDTGTYLIAQVRVGSLFKLVLDEAFLKLLV
jgi:hypothetical protein